MKYYKPITGSYGIWAEVKGDSVIYNYSDEAPKEAMLWEGHYFIETKYEISEGKLIEIDIKRNLKNFIKC
jgi:hypothetical protein